MKEEITTLLLGELSLAFYIVFTVFALFGALVSMLLHLRKKQKGDFSFKFWLADNWVRFIWAIILALVVARFFYEMESWLAPIFNKVNLPYDLNMLVGLIIGFFSDKIIIGVRNKTNLNLFQQNEKSN